MAETDAYLRPADLGTDKETRMVLSGDIIILSFDLEFNVEAYRDAGYVNIKFGQVQWGGSVARVYAKREITMQGNLGLKRTYQEEEHIITVSND